MCFVHRDANRCLLLFLVKFARITHAAVLTVLAETQILIILLVRLAQDIVRAKVLKSVVLIRLAKVIARAMVQTLVVLIPLAMIITRANWLN